MSFTPSGYRLLSQRESEAKNADSPGLITNPAMSHSVRDPLESMWPALKQRIGQIDALRLFAALGVLVFMSPHFRFSQRFFRRSPSVKRPSPRSRLLFRSA